MSINESERTSVPIKQEAARGNALLDLGCDVHAEVSLYNGKTFASVRRWFQADDGKWYRTKNGLHLRYDDMVEVLAHFEELIRFMQERAQILERQERQERKVGESDHVEY